jgi:hypothetical protein
LAQEHQNCLELALSYNRIAAMEWLVVAKGFDIRAWRNAVRACVLDPAALLALKHVSCGCP